MSRRAHRQRLPTLHALRLVFLLSRYLPSRGRARAFSANGATLTHRAPRCRVVTEASAAGPSFHSVRISTLRDLLFHEWIPVCFLKCLKWRINRPAACDSSSNFRYLRRPSTFRRNRSSSSSTLSADVLHARFRSWSPIALTLSECPSLSDSEASEYLFTLYSIPKHSSYTRSPSSRWLPRPFLLPRSLSRFNGVLPVFLNLARLCTRSFLAHFRFSKPGVLLPL